MRVTRLDGPLLDFWIAKSEGVRFDSIALRDGEGGMCRQEPYCPSVNWSQGGAILANDWYEIESVLIDWFGLGWPAIKAIRDQPLMWFMRAYVATKFGDEVEEVDVRDFLRAYPSAVTDISATRPTSPLERPPWFSFRAWVGPRSD